VVNDHSMLLLQIGIVTILRVLPDRTTLIVHLTHTIIIPIIPHPSSKTTTATTTNPISTPWPPSTHLPPLPYLPEIIIFNNNNNNNNIVHMVVGVIAVLFL
jgi:hypothetical protein